SGARDWIVLVTNLLLVFILGLFSDTVKAGTCPSDYTMCKMRNPPNRCRSDSQCAGEEKCCDTGCGRGCVLTQKGTCLIVYSLWLLVPQGALTLSLLSQGQHFSL
uniref:WAP domain-containing protein n=1 Tax=Chelonoidis abingdonii TaxID=106734 RepID=A0A8C0QPM9_CHEAB